MLTDPIDNRKKCFYNTGDLVVIKNNKIFFRGRKDNQVKISGQLVVTDEVINNLEKQCKKIYKNRSNNVRF